MLQAITDNLGLALAGVAVLALLGAGLYSWREYLRGADEPLDKPESFITPLDR